MLINSVQVVRTGEHIHVLEISARAKSENSRVLQDTRQILIVGGPNSGKQLLFNHLKLKFPCPERYLNSGPFRSIYQANAFIHGRLARLVWIEHNDVYPGMLNDLLCEKPDLVVSCGHYNMEGEADYQKWHDALGGHHKFDVLWIVLPEPYRRRRIGESSNTGRSGQTSAPIQRPGGPIILQYWGEIIENTITDIGKDLIEAADLKHYIR